MSPIRSPIAILAQVLLWRWQPRSRQPLLVIATAVMLFGLNSGAALATVAEVLIEVPVMLLLVECCRRTAYWFPRSPEKATLLDPRCLRI